MNNKKEIKTSNKFIYKYTINKSENINMDQFESLITDRINWVFKEESIQNRIDFYVISFEKIDNKFLYTAYIELGLDIKKELLEKYFMESNSEMGIISSSELIVKKWSIIDELIKKGDFKSNPNLIIDNKGKRLSFKKHVSLLIFNKVPLDEITRILRNIYSEEFHFIFKGWGKRKIYRKIIMKRIESKKLYLIYKDIPLEISNNIFINNLQNNIKIDNYIISNDINQKKLKNIHIFIENKNKIRNSINKFNLKIENNYYLCEMNTKISNKKELINNLLNKKDIINNFNTIISKEFYSEKDYLLKLAKEKTPDQIESTLIEKFPNLYLNKGQSFLNTLKSISKHYNNIDLNKVESQYDLSQFIINDNLQQQFNNWNPKETSLVVHGLSGSGKTNYMLALLKSKGRKVLFISHKEDLARFDPKLHDTLLFDDMNFISVFKTKEEIIAIVDVLFPRTFKVLYQAINLPQGVWKIFTTNENPLFPFENYLEIQRRIYKIEIDHHLYKNIQITNNFTKINNYIFNKDNNIVNIDE